MSKNSTSDAPHNGQTEGRPTSTPLEKLLHQYKETEDQLKVLKQKTEQEAQQEAEQERRWKAKQERRQKAEQKRRQKAEELEQLLKELEQKAAKEAEQEVLRKAEEERQRKVQEQQRKAEEQRRIEAEEKLWEADEKFWKALEEADRRAEENEKEEQMATEAAAAQRPFVAARRGRAPCEECAANDVECVPSGFGRQRACDRCRGLRLSCSFRETRREKRKERDATPQVVQQPSTTMEEELRLLRPAIETMVESIAEQSRQLSALIRCVRDLRQDVDSSNVKRRRLN